MLNRDAGVLTVNGIYLEEIQVDTIAGFEILTDRKKRIELGDFLIDGSKNKIDLTDPAFLLVLDPNQSYEYIFSFTGLGNFLIRQSVGTSPISKFNLAVSYKDPNTGVTTKNPLREFVFWKCLKSN